MSDHLIITIGRECGSEEEISEKSWQKRWA